MFYWFSQALSKYADFSGRARRKEYWYFSLALFISYILAGAVDTFLHLGFSEEPGFSRGWLSLAVSLFFLIPSLSVSIRRLHDLDKSGWWLLLQLIPLIGPIIVLVWFCFQGTTGSNRFGPDPLGFSPDIPPRFGS